VRGQLGSTPGLAEVTSAKKAIQVKTPYRTAAVVVAIEHRKYTSLISPLLQLRNR
jgi:hypothetical protein